MPSQTKKILTPALATLAALALAGVLFVPVAATSDAGRPEAATPAAALDALVQRDKLTRQDADDLSTLLAKGDRGSFTPEDRDLLQGVIDRLGASAAAPSSPVVVPRLPSGPTLAADAPCTQCILDLVTCVVSCLVQFIDCLASSPPLQCVAQFLACIQDCVSDFVECIRSCTLPLVDVARQADLGRSGRPIPA